MTDNIEVNRRVESDKTIEVCARQRILDVSQAQTFFLKELNTLNRFLIGPRLIGIDGNLHLLANGLAHDLQPAQIALHIRVAYLHLDRGKATMGKTLEQPDRLFLGQRKVQAAGIGANAITI